MSHVQEKNQGGLGQLVSARHKIWEGLAILGEALTKVNGASGDDYMEIE